MARLQSSETIKEYQFQTLLLQIVLTAKGGRRITGYLKTPLNGLATDVVLFDDEERLGALLDDVAEALQIVTAEKKDAQNV